MSQWCVESYPSSLYKFEIFSKLMFLAFCPQFWPWSGGSKSMPSKYTFPRPFYYTLSLGHSPARTRHDSSPADGDSVRSSSGLVEELKRRARTIYSSQHGMPGALAPSPSPVAAAAAARTSSPQPFPGSPAKGRTNS